MTSGYLNSMLIKCKTVSYSVKNKTETEYNLNDGNIDHKI